MRVTTVHKVISSPLVPRIQALSGFLRHERYKRLCHTRSSLQRIINDEVDFHDGIVHTARQGVQVHDVRGEAEVRRRLDVIRNLLVSRTNDPTKLNVLVEITSIWKEQYNAYPNNLANLRVVGDSDLDDDLPQAEKVLDPIYLYGTHWARQASGIQNLMSREYKRWRSRWIALRMAPASVT